MPETKVGFSVRLGELWREHPVQVLLATVALLGVGAAVGILAFRALTSGGDEPPIRVKGGSLKVEMERAGSSKHLTSAISGRL